MNIEISKTSKLNDAVVWLPWIPLLESWKGDRTPPSAGLYRIRRVGREELDYIGQTGEGSMTLGKRLGMLRGVWGEKMPYRDPHTAGPGLWALRHRDSCEFEVSVAVVTGDTAWRKGLECAAIADYRRRHLNSPTVNFGRMPTGYFMSSGNNAALVSASKRQRGGPTTDQLPCHMHSLRPTSEVHGPPSGLDWCGHPWSAWSPIQDAVPMLSQEASGLYRLRAHSHDGALLYIGQGRLRSRLIAHAAKAAQAGHRQQMLFATPMECSWVEYPKLPSGHLLELECDLIGAYIGMTRQVPPAQFIG